MPWESCADGRVHISGEAALAQALIFKFLLSGVEITPACAAANLGAFSFPTKTKIPLLPFWLFLTKKNLVSMLYQHPTIYQ